MHHVKKLYSSTSTHFAPSSLPKQIFEGSACHHRIGWFPGDPVTSSKFVTLWIWNILKPEIFLESPRLMEFIEGAARLRGNAKALDIWRIETKMEAGQMGTPGTAQGRRSACKSTDRRVSTVSPCRVLEKWGSDRGGLEGDENRLGRITQSASRCVR